MKNKRKKLDQTFKRILHSNEYPYRVVAPQYGRGEGDKKDYTKLQHAAIWINKQTIRKIIFFVTLGIFLFSIGKIAGHFLGFEIAALIMIVAGAVSSITIYHMTKAF